MRKFAPLLLLGVITSGALAQIYQDTQGRATGRRQASWLDLSLLMGKGEDWLEYPTIDVSFNTQFQYDYQANRSGGDTNNLVNTSDLSTIFRFAPRLAIYSDITLDQINGPGPGEDSWLEGEGIFSSNLFLQYSNQIVTLGGGGSSPQTSASPMRLRPASTAETSSAITPSTTSSGSSAPWTSGANRSAGTSSPAVSSLSIERG